MVKHLPRLQHVLRELLSLQRPDLDVLVDRWAEHIDAEAARKECARPSIEASGGVCLGDRAGGVVDELDLLKPRVPDADGAIGGNRDDLLLLLENLHVKDRSLWMAQR